MNMKFSNTKPIVPGFYWIKCWSWYNAPTVVEVYETHTGVLAVRMGTYVNSYKAEWAGPLEVPAENG